MKKLGLIGGTGPESTVIYYNEINKRISKETDGKAFPEMVIESVNLNKALGLVAEEKYDDLEKYLSTAIKNLEASGADIVALSAATMHIVFDRLSQKVKVPFISIPKTAAEYAESMGYKKVGLIGTIFTMEKDYLRESFTCRGIEVIVPNREERIIINNRISNELEYGVVKESSRAELISIIDRMKKDSGIEAIILGCTELPLALNSDNCPVECIDIMELHIKKLVQLILE